MKKLLLFMILIPQCFACEKETNEGEPEEQYHFINLVDESGQNLFESNQIPPSEFTYGTESWEDLIEEKEHYVPYFKTFTEESDTLVEILENHEYLIIEQFQGDRERVFSIQGVEYTFTLSPLFEGFFQNGNVLKYSTDKIGDHGTFYFHNVVLEEF